MAKNKSFCGIDPGFSGGISIIVGKNIFSYKMPIIKIESKVCGKKKIKTVYDLISIRAIFNKHLDKNSIVVLEKVSSRPGEGTVSSFNFGRGYGNIEGLITGLLGISVVEITPAKWKKHYPQLVSDEIIEKKNIIKDLNDKSKTLKDKTHKKANKKEIDKFNRQIKNCAKNGARILACKLFPEVSEILKYKNSDGVAESILIAKYGKDNQNELV